jgi:hypothetical protein
MLDSRALLLSLALATGVSGCYSDDTANDHSDDSSDSKPSEAEAVKKVLAKLRTCHALSDGSFATDQGAAEKIKICGLDNAFFWQADLDVECDGKRSSDCNELTDSAFLPFTSSTDSNGDSLDAATLPYVVLPTPSSRFDYREHETRFGQVVAVVHDGDITFGVFGDEGHEGVVGAASLALAKNLGINPDPIEGGVDGGATFIVFTGDDGVVGTIEDHEEATELGRRKLLELIEEN